jgi:type III secretion protein L
MTKVIKHPENESYTEVTPRPAIGDANARPPIIDKKTYEARSEAQLIRRQALAEAERIIQTANREAEDLRRHAREQGYHDGRDAAAAELSEIIAVTAQRMRQIEAQAEPQLRDLALAIARKIIGKELEFAPEMVVEIIREALADKARQRREIYLRVHPDDMEFVRQHKPDLVEVLSRAKEIGLREDPDVARHGVIIETEAGTIDAQLDTQLAVFERVFKGVR